MRYLLDTNVVCEPTAAAPNPRVLAWIGRQDWRDIFVSVVTLAEIAEGVARLPAGRRRDRLDVWRRELIESLDDRILLLDEQIAGTWGALRAQLAAEHRTIGPMDAFIAATAQNHGLTLVTRNERHFTAWGGPVLNPWMESVA